MRSMSLPLTVSYQGTYRMSEWTLKYADTRGEIHQQVAEAGSERELRDREAGFRTHMLVCIGSALFTIVSAYGFREFLTSGDQVVRADPTRIAAQIVTGIGFLGAGAIIRQGVSIRGLTTAATLWVAAAIGMAAGAGYYSGAVIGTVVTLIALWPLRRLAFPVFERLRRSVRANSMISAIMSAYECPDFLAAIKNSELLESHGL